MTGPLPPDVFLFFFFLFFWGGGHGARRFLCQTYGEAMYGGLTWSRPWLAVGAGGRRWAAMAGVV